MREREREREREDRLQMRKHASVQRDELGGLEDVLGSELPGWVRERLREKREKNGMLIPVDYWENMKARKPSIMKRFRYWINDADTKDTCTVFTQAWLNPKHEEMSRDLATLIGNTSRDVDMPLPEITGVGVFKRNTGGPPDPPSVHGGAIATMFDTFLEQTNMVRLSLSQLQPPHQRSLQLELSSI